MYHMTEGVIGQKRERGATVTRKSEADVVWWYHACTCKSEARG